MDKMLTYERLFIKDRKGLSACFMCKGHGPKDKKGKKGQRPKRKRKVKKYNGPKDKKGKKFYYKGKGT